MNFRVFRLFHKIIVTNSKLFVHFVCSFWPTGLNIGAGTGSGFLGATVWDASTDSDGSGTFWMLWSDQLSSWTTAREHSSARRPFLCLTSHNSPTGRSEGKWRRYYPCTNLNNLCCLIVTVRLLGPRYASNACPFGQWFFQCFPSWSLFGWWFFIVSLFGFKCFSPTENGW